MSVSGVRQTSSWTATRVSMDASSVARRLAPSGATGPAPSRDFVHLRSTPRADRREQLQQKLAEENRKLEELQRKLAEQADGGGFCSTFGGFFGDDNGAGSRGTFLEQIVRNVRTRRFKLDPE